MAKYFKIKGYWKDTKERIDDYIICSDEFDEQLHSGVDDEVFFYGLDRERLFIEVVLKEDTDLDFVIEHFEEISMNWTVEKKDEIESILFSMWGSIGMAIPENFEDIVQYCYEDVCETADTRNWSNGDVAIAFRRWIEAQSDNYPIN